MSKDPTAHNANDHGTAGVIARPPVLFLVALLLGLALDRLLPVQAAVLEANQVRWVTGTALVLDHHASNTRHFSSSFTSGFSSFDASSGVRPALITSLIA